MLRPRIAATVLALALGLTACGSSATDQANSKSDPDGVLEKVEVTGGDDKTAPTFDLKEKPLKADKAVSRVLTEGDGAEVTKDDLVTLDIAIVNGKDGKVVNESYTQDPATLPLFSPSVPKGVRDVLVGKKVGSRVITALPGKDVFGPQGNPQVGMTAEDPVLIEMDIKKATTLLTKAEGKAVPAKKGLPTVKADGKKPATITMPKAAPSKKLVVQDLVTGDGPAVKKGDTVYVHYTGALYRNGKVFDSSLERGEPFNFTVGQGGVIKAWDTGLIGKKVGSRVLMVVPPKDGYGSKGYPQGGIKGTDTLVFVIDILGVV